VLEGGLDSASPGERVEQRPNPVGKTAQNCVRERHGALETRPAHELDRFVHCRIAGHAVHEAQLIRAEPQRSADRRIETSDSATAERFDRVIERPDSLDGPVGEALRERAIPCVEACHCRSKRPVGVGAVLEDAQEHLKRRSAGGSYDRSPRSHAS
jgi:hypothetical protein